MPFLPMTHGGGNEVNLNYDNCVIFPGNYTSGNGNIGAQSYGTVTITKEPRLIVWEFAPAGNTGASYSTVRQLGIWDTEKKQGSYLVCGSGNYTTTELTSSNISGYVSISSTTITIYNKRNNIQNMSVIVYYK